jgi:hypothetical protein
MVDYNLSIMFGAHESCLNYLRIQVPSRSSWFVHWTIFSVLINESSRPMFVGFRYFGCLLFRLEVFNVYMH